nr:hypothetical protein [Tanacetum cinerariifolium]
MDCGSCKQLIDEGGESLWCLITWLVIKWVKIEGKRGSSLSKGLLLLRVIEEEVGDDLDKLNETIAKYLQEYQDFASELPLEQRIELISDLVKYQDNYSKVYKFQSQQRRPMTKKQKREYYMAVIKRNLGWRFKYFKGMTFEEIEAKFADVWKHVEDFIPMGSKEETERLKRKGLNLEKEQNFIRAPVEWKLYDLSRVHHLTAKDKEIFMLVEKDYPLRKGLALVMINYKLQVENYLQMAKDLIRKIYNIANTSTQQARVMWRLFVVVVGRDILRDQWRRCGHFKDQEMDYGACKKLVGEGGESLRCLDAM